MQRRTSASAYDEMIGEMTDSKDLLSRVRSWLGQQGYPLEMRVATTFQSAGFAVLQSTYYVDESGKAREIDVTANIGETWRYYGQKTDGLVHFELFTVCECKSGPKAQRPWVVFSGDWWPNERDDETITFYPGTDLGRRVLAIVRGDAEDVELFAMPDRCGYSAACAFSEHDTAFAAISSLAAAAHSKSKVKPDEFTSVCRIVIPLLVVSTPLFECWLDDSGEMRLEERDSIVLKWNNPVVLHGSATVMHVVHERALPDFAAKIRAAFEHILAKYERRIDAIVAALTDNPVDAEAKRAEGPSAAELRRRRTEPTGPA